MKWVSGIEREIFRIRKDAKNPRKTKLSKTHNVSEYILTKWL